MTVEIASNGQQDYRAFLLVGVLSSTLATLFALVMFEWMIFRITRLTQAADGFARGNFDIVIIGRASGWIATHSGELAALVVEFCLDKARLSAAKDICAA